MIRSLVQFSLDRQRGVAALDDAGTARVLNGAHSTYALAERAVANGQDAAVGA